MFELLEDLPTLQKILFFSSTLSKTHATECSIHPTFITTNVLLGITIMLVNIRLLLLLFLCKEFDPLLHQVQLVPHLLRQAVPNLGEAVDADKV